MVRRPRKYVLWLLLTGIAITTAATVISCNWNLKTRTPPVDERKTAPDFSLPDHKGSAVSLDALVANGPAVVVFYRGFW